MIELDRCLPPIRGLSMRERREAGRGDVGCRLSESEDEQEALEVVDEMDGRLGMAIESRAFMDERLRKEGEAAGDDGERGIWCREMLKESSRLLYTAVVLLDLPTLVGWCSNDAWAFHAQLTRNHMDPISVQSTGSSWHPTRSTRSVAARLAVVLTEVGLLFRLRGDGG